MSEAILYVFEVFYTDGSSDCVDSSTYRAEDEAHAIEILYRHNPDCLVESVEYRGEA